MRLPMARSEGLVIEELDGELLVYDLDSKQAHCLSPSVARVWRRCDGITSSDTIAEQLGLDEAAITHALDEIGRCELLITVPDGERLSRRDLGLRVTKVAVGVATVPLILSVAAPAAAQTASQIETCRILGGGLGSGECGTCNQGGSPTFCCCCHYGPGLKFCAAGDMDCANTAPTLPDYMGAMINCTEQDGDPPP